MRSRTELGPAIAAVLPGSMIGPSTPHTSALRFVDEKILREYGGAHQRDLGAFLYLEVES